MIFKLSVLLLSLYIFTAQAFDKDFKAVNDRIPLEFTHLFNSIKTGVKTPAEKIRLVGLCKDLDENLGYFATKQIYFLMKSEVIKNVLEFKFKKVRQFDITTLLINRLSEELKKKEQFLNPFSRWIWRSILVELQKRKELGIITNRSFIPANFDGKKRIEAERFARYLRYLLPWIDRMDSLTPSEFNDLSKEVSWVVLRRLNDRSLLLKRFAQAGNTSTKVALFNIPKHLLELHPEEIKRMQKDETPLTLTEEGQKAESEARKQVQDISPTDLSPLSDEISNELEKKSP